MSLEVSYSPLVERTAQRILEQLQSGRFIPEEPLPTHRAWAKELNVSHFTVSKAMEALKERDVVESSEGSYTFMRRPVSYETASVVTANSEMTDVQLSLWYNGVKNVRRLRQSIVRQRFQNEFSAKNPHVQFKEARFELPFDKFRSQLLEGFLQGDGPIVGELPQTYLEFLSAHHSLGDFPVDDERARYFDALDDPFKEHVYEDGKCQFVPFSCSFSYLVCNKSLMKEAGLDPNVEFRSWSHFADVCEGLKKKHGFEPFHVSEMGLFWLLSQWIYQSMPDLPKGGRLPLIDWQSDVALKGFNFLKEMLFERKLIKVKDIDMISQTSPFLAGKVPIVLSEIMLSSALELNHAEAFSVKLHPPGPAGHKLSLMNAAGWVMNANASPLAQRCAGEYILDWESWVHMRDGGAAMRKMGVAPSLISLFKDGRKDGFHSDKVPKAWKRTFEDAKEYGRWEASDSDFVISALRPVLRAQLRGEAAPNANEILKHFMLAQYDAGILGSAHEGSVPC